MTFARPLWLWAFALIPIFAALFLRNEAARTNLLRKLVAARLQERLAGTVSVAKRRLRFALLLLGMSCVIVSLAQPQLGFTWEKSRRKGRDVLIAIDVSKSMLATDLEPNRLTRAKLAAQDLIAQLGGDRVGLIAFSGGAFLQAPLTADHNAVLESLREIDPEIIPRGGTDLAEAIRVAGDAFGKGESDHRALIIFTDGEELDADGIKAAEKLRDVAKVFGVGVGSEDGALIPVPGPGGATEFLKDESGQFVKTRLDEGRLRKIAELTGGFYVRLQNGPAEITRIVRDGLGHMIEKDIDARTSRQPIERYQWSLGLGLALLASTMLMGERRRRLRSSGAALLFTACWMQGPTASAVPWLNTPGVDHYRAGERALTGKDEAKAREEFEEAHRKFEEQWRAKPDSPERNFNLGTAAYKLNREDEALVAFGKALLSDDPKLRLNAETNLGHTLYRSGEKKLPKDRKATLKDWTGALSHYDSALRIDPRDEQVRSNREYVQKRIDELKKEEEKKDEKKDDQQKNEQQKRDDQKKEQQQKKDDQKGGSKDQEQKNEPSQGDGEKQKQDQNSPPKDDGKSGTEEQKEPSGGGKKMESESPQPGKDGQPQEGKKEQPQPAKNESAQQQQAEAGKDAEGNKPTGELKGNAAEAQDAQNAEAAADQLAAAEGKMTEQQAKALLDSLKAEDDRVRLVDPNDRKHNSRVMRDW